MNKPKKHFTCVCRRECLLLKDDYKEVKNEIISFIDSKTENSEVIKKGEIEELPHFNELPCDLEIALTLDVDIEDSFKAYIWSLIQTGDIDVWDWDSLDDVVCNEIGYLTCKEE